MRKERQTNRRNEWLITGGLIFKILNSRYSIFSFHNAYHSVTSSDKIIMSPHQSSKYCCNLCDILLSSMGSVAKHKRAVHEGVKFTWKLCDYQATTKSSLAQHKRAVHEGVKFPCNICTYQASYRSDLTRHKKRKHIWKIY